MSNDYEREEVVAKLVAIIDESVKKLRRDGTTKEKLVEMLHDTDSGLFSLLETMKDDIKKYKIEPHEVFLEFLKADNSKENEELKTCVSQVEITNDDITSVVNGVEVETSIAKIFQKRKSLRVWTRSFFSFKVLPEYRALSKRHGGRPDSVLVQFNNKHDVATVKTTCFRLDEDNPQIKEMDDAIKQVVDSAPSAVEIRKLELVNLVACTIFIRGEIYEVSYYKVSKSGRVAEDPRVSFRDKEAHDRWINKLVQRTAEKHSEDNKEDKAPVDSKHKPVNRIKFSEN